MTRLRLSAALMAALLTACGPAKPDGPSAGGASAGCMSRAYPNIGGPISLVNQAGEQVTEEAYKGHPTLIYFGFTYCPDVCPMTLVTVKRAYDRLPEGVSPPQTLLISIDPERDTPEQLALYVSTSAFPDNLQGLTGTTEEVRAAADAFLADYSRIEQTDSASEYSMDHTSLLYLMDEDWQLKTFFTHEDTDETIATCLTEILQ
ncbi:SCO family protein [uncultured Hyphomonas sp.]|uniref:SCO family protein n=1 Tax=uncultured Hyphomonas sp. TaxID=225298 RepID=UPI002AAAAAAC|nr:SCO family protein [uncultured Hyphomonas sp.]